MKMAKKFGYFDNWKTEILHCNRCGWTGTFDQGVVEYHEQLMDSSCPVCDFFEAPMLAIVGYPKSEQSGANSDKIIEFPLSYRLCGEPKWYQRRDWENGLTYENLPKYFFAVCEEKIDGYTTYPLFFINNANHKIDEIIIVRPGIYSKIGDARKIDEIDNILIKRHHVVKYENVPPQSFLREATLQDWDFDFTNSRKVFMKVNGQDLYLRCYMEKYFICSKKSYIDFLGKEGWVCSG
jgi:hypothetical protein